MVLRTMFSAVERDLDKIKFSEDKDALFLSQ